MFWSMNKSTVLIRAGKKAAQRAQTGSDIKGTSHGRPTVVVSAVGTLRVGRARAYLCKRASSTRGTRGTKNVSVEFSFNPSGTSTWGKCIGKMEDFSRIGHTKQHKEVC